MLFQFSECDWHGIWKQHSAQTVRRGSSYFRLQKKTSLQKVWSVLWKKKIYSGITKIGFRMKNWGLTRNLRTFYLWWQIRKEDLAVCAGGTRWQWKFEQENSCLAGFEARLSERGSKEWRQLYLRRKIRLRLRTAFCAQNPGFPVQRILIRLFIILHLL